MDEANNGIHEGHSCRIAAIIPDTLTVSVSDASGTEGGNVVFDISLNRAPQRAVDFWVTTDRKSGDTTSSNDYSYSSRLLTMVRNQTTTTFTVSTNQDTTYEGDETFSVEITIPTNVEIGRGVARGTILEDDPKPLISFPSRTRTPQRRLVVYINDFFCMDISTGIARMSRTYTVNFSESGT